MFDKDYLVRLIEQYAKALAYILGLVNTHRYPEAMSAINEELEDLLKLNSTLINTFDAPSLMNMITLGGSMPLEKDRGTYAAALLRTAGTIQEAQGQPEAAYHYKLKALHLLLHLAHEYRDLPTYSPNIGELITELEDYVLPLDTNYLLLNYYEQQGAFSTAEDLLFDLLDRDELDRDEENHTLIETGIAFYKRLNALSDEALMAGNLPREELVEGLAHFFTLQDAADEEEI